MAALSPAAPTRHIEPDHVVATQGVEELPATEFRPAVAVQNTPSHLTAASDGTGECGNRELGLHPRIDAIPHDPVGEHVLDRTEVQLALPCLGSSSRRNTARKVGMLPGPKYSKEQKLQFFELLDRDGSVRVAADAVGFNVHAAYSWVRQAGLVMQRRAPRKYSAQEKADFLRLAAERMNISTTTRDSGIHRPTAYA